MSITATVYYTAHVWLNIEGKGHPTPRQDGVERRKKFSSTHTQPRR